MPCHVLGKKKMAKGGYIGSYQSSCSKDCVQPCKVHGVGADLVGQVLAKRMSQGGRVANETEPVADFLPNEFDDLVLRDGLSFSYTGANSGDHLGHDDEEKRHNERVALVMMKRRKQHNPKPA